LSEEVNFYEKMGGEKNFLELTRRFYENVSKNLVLKPMYPEDDMAGAERRLTDVLRTVLGRT
jgi:hemoglobin